MYKILCTGNPEHFTIARAIKEIFPQAHFASRATGYDLRMWEQSDEIFFCDSIKNYNILINSSHISYGAQQKILSLTQEHWKAGHVFNIGSTAEYEGRNSFFPLYSVEKRALRDMSLSMNSKYFKTTHMTIGGLNDQTPENKFNLDTRHVANTIKWILESNLNIPIIGIEQ